MDSAHEAAAHRSTGHSLKDERRIRQASQRGENQTDLICQAV